MTGEQIGVTAATGLALLAAGMCAIGLVGDLDVLGDGASVAGWTLAVLVGIALLAGTARFVAGAGGIVSGRNTVTVHSHAGGDLRTARLHEAGHAVRAQQLGGRVVAMRVEADGSGWCRAEFDRPLTPRERASLAYAGGLAAGESLSGRPCSGDRHNATAAVSAGHRWGERGEVHRQARADARSGVGYGLLGPRANVRRMADRVEGPR